MSRGPGRELTENRYILRTDSGARSRLPYCCVDSGPEVHGRISADWWVIGFETLWVKLSTLQSSDMHNEISMTIMSAQTDDNCKWRGNLCAFDRDLREWIVIPWMGSAKLRICSMFQSYKFEEKWNPIEKNTSSLAFTHPAFILKFSICKWLTFEQIIKNALHKSSVAITKV